MVTDKGHLPGGKLDADLMSAACMQADTNKTKDFFSGVNRFLQIPFTGRFLNAFTLFSHDKGLVSPSIMIQQIRKYTKVCFGNVRVNLLRSFCQETSFSRDSKEPKDLRSI